MNKENSSKTTFIPVGVAAVIAVIGVGMAVYALTLGPSEDSSAKHSTNVAHEHSAHAHDDSVKAPAASTEAAALTISYTNDGFALTEFTVKASELVRVENNSDTEMYFAAGEHEHHDINSPVNLGTIEPGAASSFIAPKAGTYLFHNHDNDEHKSTLVVQ